MSSEIEPFVHNANSPDLYQVMEGIAIDVQPRSSNPSAMVLNGICRASEETASKLTDTILHNVAIICTCGTNLVPISFPLIRDQVVFPEDVHKKGGYQTAFFNIDLSACGLPPDRSPYYLLAAFHRFLSETIQFDWSK